MHKEILEVLEFLKELRVGSFMVNNLLNCGLRGGIMWFKDSIGRYRGDPDCIFNDLMVDDCIFTQ